ncbi:hypothetical protein [Coralloluteibacterium thermophilus]|uniref:Uncharacterized protein n=1 Tax=Coralloluteibacterium thermophilum TaxID=2707049 RepID=A0ABV9NPP9_9GAMM
MTAPARPIAANAQQTPEQLRLPETMMLTKYQTAFCALLQAVDEGEALPRSVLDVLERGTPLIERAGDRVHLNAEGEQALRHVRREIARELTRPETLGPAVVPPARPLLRRIG